MRWRLAIIGGALVVAVLLVAAVLTVVSRREPDLPTFEARAFLAAWAKGDAPAIDQLAVADSGASADLTRFKGQLGITSSTLELGKVRREPGVTAAVSAVHQIRGLGEWRVQSFLRFARRDGRWLVDWAPSAFHPDAQRGDRFERARTRPPRAAILGAGDQPLTTIGKVIAIGVRPSWIKDQAAVGAALQQQVGVDPARLDRELKAPGVEPDHFVPLVEVREERYRQVDAALRPVPGVIFRPKDARITPSEAFAAHTIGRTGEITAEQLQELGSAYQQGDAVGRSGLELAMERDLAGTPSGEIRLARAAGEKQVLERFAGTAPKPVTTTLRADVQSAADAALEGVTVPAALVAVDASTGAILAVASRPLPPDQLNRGLAGRYPPGSTFKIVTTDALIAAGGAEQRLACPAVATVGGKQFKNFEGEALGDITLRDAFVHSCNTAFAAAAARLPDDQLVAAAGRYGFGVEYSAGLGTKTPSGFPVPEDEAERAAAAIGQGRVLATPAHMASVAAAATTGTWHAPYLLSPAPGSAAGPTVAPSPAAVGPIRAFMRGVVTEGTGTAAVAVPDLVGKTGTAEFGTGNPLPTHAWFVGARNGIAFSVVLEGGGVGGRDAAPRGARFAATL